MNSFSVLVGKAFAPSMKGQWYGIGLGQVIDWKRDTCCFPG